jgi:hypothetical protein
MTTPSSVLFSQHTTQCKLATDARLAPVFGIGRGGAFRAPILAGTLFSAGYGLQFVAIAMSAGSLVAAAYVVALKLPPQRLTTAAAS